ncbi:SpoIIE family protein phosphatase [Streptacidiphilus carbonis]|uniref:SpoIIE family protein phosphatase n=1 Tax=Streptacidiphilus carbonis TaxID=105422 RepID=UPI000694C431|nr:SpoIIE family protein phosphatase [Streptacidiphilus carbonis]
MESQPQQAPQQRATVEPDPTIEQPRLAVAARAARAGAYEWDLATGDILWDDAVCRMVGTAPEAFDGRAEALFGALHPDDATRLAAATAEVIERGGTYRNRYEVVHADGSVRQLEERGEVLLGADGRPDRVTGLLLDRTDESADPGRPLAPTPVVRPRAPWFRSALPWRGGPDAAGPADSFMLTLTRALSKAASVAEVTRVMTDIARPALNAEHLLIEADAQDPQHPCSVVGGAATEAMRRAVRDDHPIFLEGAAVPVDDGGPAVVRSWAVLPLTGADDGRGACLFDFAGTRHFDDGQRTLFTAVAGILAHALARARLYDREHQWAAELQRAMLPRRVPAVPGHGTAVRYLPGTTGMAVGGDWYDVLDLPDGRVGLVVGDVQGHSVEASAVMGQLRIALRAYAAEGHSPGTVLARTGRLLADLDTDLFATCCYLSLDPATGEVEAARAGHPLPVRIQDGPGPDGGPATAVELDLPGGPPLGVDPQAHYPETATVLAQAETLLLYTDGLIECRGESIDTSLERLLATVTDWTRDAARDSARDGTGPADGPSGPDRLELLADHLVRPCQAQSPRADDVAVFLLQRRSQGW